MNISLGKVNFKNILLLLLAIGFSFCKSGAFAADNVLQAIQVDGFKDSYNIILKSDDIADMKKTVQAPNKMMINLKGIRASKTINTIYNNTASVDSVVVEPIGDDAIKILIQADNASNAEVHFDTLRTPLGVLDKSTKQNKVNDELVLNNPMASYKPVYDNNSDTEVTGGSLTGVSDSVLRHLKRILKNEKISWTITFGLFVILMLSGIKLIKGKDNDIKVGLTQSLKEREIDLYRGLGINGEMRNMALNANHGDVSQQNPASSYGLRAYQQGVKSPYVSTELQRPRPAVAPTAPASNLNQQVARPLSPKPAKQGHTQGQMQNQMSLSAQNTIQRTAPSVNKSKTTNIDSMKFLESMTKIYEKNGRSDLAQGLKTNMKKAKINLA